MKLEKDKLIEMLNAQCKTIMESDDFTARVKETFKQMFEELRNETVTPMSQSQGKMLLANLPFAKASGDLLYTDSGSIINMKNKNAPWMKLSKDVQDWAVDFVNYIKTGVKTKLLNSGTDTDGGFLVPEDFRAIMIMYDVEDTLVWSRATVWPMSGPKLSMPRLLQNPDVEDASYNNFAGVTFDWVEEGGEKPETQPEFGFLELVVHELAGYTEVTNTLLEDSVLGLVNYLTRIFRQAWYWTTDVSFLTGPGGKRPLGIITDPNTLLVNRETANNVTVTDIINMESRLPAMFDNGSVYFISKKARANLRGQKTDAGELVLREFYNQINEPYQMTLLGIPCVLGDGKLPTLGKVGDVILANWKWYYIGQRTDFSMDSSIHYQFRKNRTALRCSGRVDGQSAVPQAFVVLGDPS